MWQTSWGKRIHVTKSGFEVHQNLFYRWLKLGNGPLQTVIHRRKPQKGMLYYLPVLTLMARKFPGTTCLLGLGGGGVLHMLADSPRKCAVEIDPEVIEIAREYFFVENLTGLDIVAQGAAEFLTGSSNTFNHLLVDLYNVNAFPKDCLNEAFFNLCKQRLTVDGYLAVNLANGFEQLEALELIKTAFVNTLSVPIVGCQNLVVIASNGAKDEFIDTMRQTKAFRKLYWLEKWGNVGTT